MPRRVPSHKPSSLVPVAQTPKRKHEDRAFYSTQAWRGPNGARMRKLRADPLCERCKREGRYVSATHVHHKVEVQDDPSRALDQDNLESLCTSCHSRQHSFGRG